MEERLCGQCEMPEIEKVPPCPLQCRAKQCKAYQSKAKFDPKTKPIVWVLGGPCSGRLTQCRKIMETYGFVHLATGDIIKSEVFNGLDATRSKCLNSIVERKGRVPNDVVCSILKEAMDNAVEAGCNGFLIDGYPRDKYQGLEFERMIGCVTLILYLDVIPDTLIARMLSKAKAKGRNTNLKAISRDVMTTLKDNHGIREHYGDKVVIINANGSPDEIFGDIRNAMDPMVAHVNVLAAEAAENKAIKNANEVNAYAGTSIRIAKSSIARSIQIAKNQERIAKAKAIAATAEAQVKAAHELTEAAKARALGQP